MIRTVLYGLVTLVSLAAQTPQFEVASIKPTGPEGQHRISINFQPGGRFTATGITTKLLIQEAFDVRDSQISGGPGWVSSDGFDINAKAVSQDAAAPPSASEEQRVASMKANRLRLQSLLIERYHLKFHREMREQQVFALVVARGGPKMKASAAVDGPGSQGFRISRGSMTGQKVSMESLAQALARPLGRTVVNKTGLSGLFEVNLEWTPDAGQSFGAAPDAPPQANDAPGPSIFSALQERLGVRVESEKAQVEQLVIDFVDKPSEN